MPFSSGIKFAKIKQFFLRKFKCESIGLGDTEYDGYLKVSTSSELPFKLPPFLFDFVCILFFVYTYW